MQIAFDRARVHLVVNSWPRLFPTLHERNQPELHAGNLPCPPTLTHLPPSAETCSYMPPWPYQHSSSAVPPYGAITLAQGTSFHEMCKKSEQSATKAEGDEFPGNVSRPSSGTATPIQLLFSVFYAHA